MSADRLKRINALLRREIAESLFEIINDPGFDFAAVSVTSVLAAKNLRTARVMVSIRNHKGEREAILATLKKHRPEIQQRINRDLAIKYTPRLIFELDTSVERGDHILAVLEELDEKTPGPAGDEAPEPEDDGEENT